MIRPSTAAFALCCALGVASPMTFAQAESPNAPATRANSPDDAKIADRVSTQLNADPHHLYRHVTVTVSKGVVTLGGLAYSNDALDRAKEIAKNTPGVSSVKSTIELEREGPPTPGH